MASAPSATRARSRTWAPVRSRQWAWTGADWPSTASRRWALRLLLALPFAALAFWVTHLGYSSSPRTLLEQHAAAVRTGWHDLSAAQLAYPPLLTGPLALLPTGWRPAAQSIVGAFAAGTLLSVYLARLVVARLPAPLIVLLCAALLGDSSLWYLSAQDLSGITSLLFLTLALGGFLRFAAFAETEGGFQAGLFLAVAFGCAAIALPYALWLIIGAPLLAVRRYRAEPAAIPATALVLGFPIAAAALGWTFTVWRLTGNSFNWLTDSRGGAYRDVRSSFGIALRDTASSIAHAPLYLLVAALILTGTIGSGYRLFVRATITLGFFIPVIILFFGDWLGFGYSRMTSFLLLTLLPAATIPARPSRTLCLLLGTAAALQLAIAITWPVAGTATVDSWMRAIF
ncbi:hypothetical protein ABUW04_04485 [Streptacidiphilus sp. N1-10]|uniref:Glycosyltransferase RgtA/B/C/D-like domain-containing protein n=1 Tax=Streptacidiphilus jeojiensis TaxID=3229225 RepID=A0ABV6XGX1_9ACTN